MRFLRSLSGVLAALLSVAVVGSAPSHAVAPDDDPLATTVIGACSGGPGRVSLTVHPPAGGRHLVEIAARGLAEGSRWRVQVVQEAGASGGDKHFRRVAVDGGWTVVTRFPASAGDVLSYVGARERGNRVHSCAVVTLSSPVYGLSECSNPRRVGALLVRELDDGSTLVRAFVGSARANSVWHLTLTATGTESRQVVEFDSHAGMGGVVRTRVLLAGMEDPRLRLLATNNAGGRCFVGLNPPKVTTDAPLTLQGLGRLSALAR